jgi:hypothetical protein
MNDDPLRQVNALLHTARTLLLEAAKGKRGTPRKRLKNIEDAVSDAIGAVACQGLTGDEIRAWRESYARRNAKPASGLPRAPRGHVWRERRIDDDDSVGSIGYRRNYRGPFPDKCRPSW